MSFGDGNLRERVGDLNRQVDKLQRANGELCAEVNRQERRIRELEELVLRAERMLTMWDKADWDCTPDEDKMGDYEPEGNLRVFQEHIAALGMEVER